jgi:hypothetical protein
VVITDLVCVLDAVYEGVSVALQGQLKVLVSLWSGNVLVYARIDIGVTEDRTPPAFRPSFAVAW